MLVFPLVFFALRLNIDGLIFPAKKSIVSDNKRFILITTILIGTIFLGASFIPSIWDAGMHFSSQALLQQFVLGSSSQLPLLSAFR